MATRKNPWWAEPENFNAPLVFLMDEGQEERIFGPSNADLHRIEEHSCTFIQLEAWFMATGQTRVTLVGPPKARQWLMRMVQNLQSRQFPRRAQGLEMLRLVWSQPLTEDALGAFPDMEMDLGDVVLVARIYGNFSSGSLPLLPLGEFF